MAKASKTDKTGKPHEGFFVETLYGVQTKQPLVKISYAGAQVCIINPKEATMLAINLIQAANASITDAFLFEFVASIGIDPVQSVQLMGTFRKWRLDHKYDLGDDLIQGERRQPR